MQDVVQLALIGAGNRGAGIFGRYALDMPHRVRFVAVVEPDTAKRAAFAAAHGLPEDRCFDSIPALFDHPPRGIQGVVIATQESQRLDPVFRSMRQGWSILVEKPLCTTPEDLIRLTNAARDYDEILIVCHQMRLSPVFKTIKRLVDSGAYGRIVCIQHSENLSWHHMAHSFVRGFFHNDRLTPMLLAKSCHDLDLLAHLTGRRALAVSSFGALTHFRRENCPPGAPAFCLEGCPHEATCPYHVLKMYFHEDTDPAYLRQMGVVGGKDELRALLCHNRFGRCVFQTDNNVVDHQTVQVAFEDGLHASFTMCGHNAIGRRMTKISLTNGEIEYDGLARQIRASSFEPREDSTVKVHVSGTHGGGDRAIMDNFLDAIVSGDRSRLLTPIRDSLEGHLLVFAAEEARRTNTVVDLRAFEARLRQSVGA